MPVSGQPQPIMIVGALILIALVGFLFLSVILVLDKSCAAVERLTDILAWTGLNRIVATVYGSQPCIPAS